MLDLLSVLGSFLFSAAGVCYLTYVTTHERTTFQEENIHVALGSGRVPTRCSLSRHTLFKMKKVGKTMMISLKLKTFCYIIVCIVKMTYSSKLLLRSWSDC